jgi:hypothetical protein
MTSTLLFRAVAVTAVLAAVAFAASCISADSYVYTAQKYDEADDCVNAYTSIEVVKGSGASANCAPSCLMVGGDLYVSTLCPPIPDIASAVDSDAGPCIAAIKAQASGGTCDNPVVDEAGTDEGGADEGGSDEAGNDEAGTDVDADTPDAAEAGGAKDAGPG